MSDELKKLSAKWKYEPMDKQAWLEREGARIGVRPGDLEKAFAEELASGPRPLDTELEIPDVMRITYRYSYGQQSPFFRALRDYGKLLGARCAACSFTYCPPRKNCSKCYGDTDWVELPGTGTVETYTTIYKGPLVKGVPKLICAYIRLDGSDFVMMSNVEMDDATKAHAGMRVQVVMKPERSGRITDFYFKLL
jgi:uncharacterized protein